MDRIDSADRGGILSDRYICRTENAGKRFIYGDNFVGRRSPYRTDMKKILTILNGSSDFRGKRFRL